MQLTTLLTAAGLITLTLAAPAPAPAAAKSMTMTNTPEWTITSFTRTCSASLAKCHYSFGIDTHTAPATHCAYNVTGAPATTQSYNSVACGAYTIGSTWSGQFGPGQGFQTLSVVKNGLIVYPAYKDSQLLNGTAVSPDMSYAPQALP
ncbi:hypothetical protein K490DRAFT_73458 [Saccharata proteae CBS 121410]|uniref:Small secreted protein n=1 Tax=Saccharata proteae CBS 121410 TaxID=1314787 RepID=A0A9P4LXS8_9PEZI|nr:hypothetical protein K490DRAFT_73458 [Saccharata proteae CBS 121410]